LGVSISAFYDTPTLANAAALAFDSIAAATPFLPGGAGLTIKATKTANNAADVRRIGKGIEQNVTPGTKVYRIFGENNNPLGESWTTVNPRKIDSFRDVSGLPDVNSGRFVIEGRITDATGITTRKALPLDGNKGGLPEVLIPNAKKQVAIDRVSGANPEF